MVGIDPPNWRSTNIMIIVGLTGFQYLLSMTRSPVNPSSFHGAGPAFPYPSRVRMRWAASKWSVCSKKPWISLTLWGIIIRGKKTEFPPIMWVETINHHKLKLSLVSFVNVPFNPLKETGLVWLARSRYQCQSERRPTGQAAGEPWSNGILKEIYHYSMDWFKGKSTGNHRFSH